MRKKIIIYIFIIIFQWLEEVKKKKKRKKKIGAEIWNWATTQIVLQERVLYRDITEVLGA